MFITGALPVQINALRLSIAQLRKRLTDISTGNHSSSITVLCGAQRAFIGANSGVIQTLLLINHAQLQIVLHQFSLLT